jgi:biotin carboxyl carrier protein
MKRYNITVNGVAYDVSVEEADGNVQAQSAPAVTAPVQAAPVQAAPTAKPAVTGGTPIKAPMPGTIVDVKIAAGKAVKRGDVILVLEAMKMENDIVAPQDGTLASVNVNKGESVAADAVLAVIA